MRKDKRRRLERAGWKIGDAADFLQLSDDERRFIETKLALAEGFRRLREHKGLTQTDGANSVQGASGAASQAARGSQPRERRPKSAVPGSGTPGH